MRKTREPVVVAAWRDHWLAGSETFIRQQQDLLPSTVSKPVGILKQDSPLARGSDTVLFGSTRLEKIRRAAFKKTGVSRRLSKFLADEKVDILHCYFLPDAFRVLSAARRKRIPLVVSVLGYDVQRENLLNDTRYRKQARRVFDYASRVVAASKYLAEKVIEMGCPADKVDTIYFGLPADRSEELEGAETKPIDVIFVGRLVEVKGVEDLMEALKIVKSRGVRCRTCIVGDGPLRHEVDRRTEEWGLEVELTGHLDPASVQRRLALSKVFVGPSRADSHGAREGLGQVFLEASQAGLPVVSYRSGGVPEAVAAGETGLLVREGDIQALADAIQRLLNDSPLRQKLGKSGQRHVATSFDAVEQARVLDSVYREVSASSADR